jgi:hypothetical protein
MYWTWASRRLDLHQSALFTTIQEQVCNDDYDQEAGRPSIEVSVPETDTVVTRSRKLFDYDYNRCSLCKSDDSQTAAS